jgi:hypothetical protein
MELAADGGSEYGSKFLFGFQQILRRFARRVQSSKCNYEGVREFASETKVRRQKCNGDVDRHVLPRLAGEISDLAGETGLRAQIRLG